MLIHFMRQHKISYKLCVRLITEQRKVALMAIEKEEEVRLQLNERTRETDDSFIKWYL